MNKQQIYKIIDDESELEGEMPDRIWREVMKGKKECALIMRVIVRQTKENIKKRILEEE